MMRLSVADGIAARGIYRDPVRSSDTTVKASGLRWLSLMLLVPIRLGCSGSGHYRF